MISNTHGDNVGLLHMTVIGDLDCLKGSFKMPSPGKIALKRKL